MGTRQRGNETASKLKRHLARFGRDTTDGMRVSAFRRLAEVSKQIRLGFLYIWSRLISSRVSTCDADGGQPLLGACRAM
jgi:hypothetical protein